MREGDDGPRNAAIRRHRAGVGHHAAGTGTHMPARHRGRASPPSPSAARRRRWSDSRNRRRCSARMSASSAKSLPLWSNAPFERDVLVAAVIARDQVFAPVFGPGERAAVLAGEPDQQHIFGRQRHLLAKSAADVGRDDPQVAFRKAEHVGNGGARQMRHLRRAGQRHAPGGQVVGGMPAARLHRRGVLAVRAGVDLDDPVGAAPDLVEAFASSPGLRR